MFWVYENWVAEKKAVIHRADCSFCREGAGVHENRLGNANGRWHGPFSSYLAANAFAQQLPDRHERDCKHCNPSAGTIR